MDKNISIKMTILGLFLGVLSTQCIFSQAQAPAGPSQENTLPPDQADKPLLPEIEFEQLIAETKAKVKSTKKLVEQANFDKFKDEQEKLAQEHFQKGNLLYEQGKSEEALAEWQKVLEIQKNIKQTAQEKKKEPWVTRYKDKKSKNELGKIITDYSTYNQAVYLYRKKQFYSSLEKFEKVQSFIPGYRKTEQYIAALKKIIAKKEKAEKIKQIQKEKNTEREEKQEPSTSGNSGYF
jgi:tetratricopeptide (TPR) repeat protein